MCAYTRVQIQPVCAHIRREPGQTPHQTRCRTRARCLNKPRAMSQRDTRRGSSQPAIVERDSKPDTLFSTYYVGKKLRFSTPSASRRVGGGDRQSWVGAGTGAGPPGARARCPRGYLQVGHSGHIRRRSRVYREVAETPRGGRTQPATRPGNGPDGMEVWPGTRGTNVGAVSGAPGGRHPRHPPASVEGGPERLVTARGHTAGSSGACPGPRRWAGPRPATVGAGGSE